MADGALNITFNDDTLADLALRAKALGMAPEDLASEMIGRLLSQPEVQLPPTRPEDYDGPYVELDDALDAFDAELDRRLASRTG